MNTKFPYHSAVTRTLSHVPLLYLVVLMQVPPGMPRVSKGCSVMHIMAIGSMYRCLPSNYSGGVLPPGRALFTPVTVALAYTPLLGSHYHKTTHGAFVLCTILRIDSAHSVPSGTHMVSSHWTSPKPTRT